MNCFISCFSYWKLEIGVFTHLPQTWDVELCSFALQRFSFFIMHLRRGLKSSLRVSPISFLIFYYGNLQTYRKIERIIYMNIDHIAIHISTLSPFFMMRFKVNCGHLHTSPINTWMYMLIELALSYFLQPYESKIFLMRSVLIHP